MRHTSAYRLAAGLSLVALVACSAPAAAPTAAPTSAAAPPAATAAPGGSAGATSAAPAAGGSVKLRSGKVTLAVLTDMSGVYSQLAGPDAVKSVQMAVDDFKAKYGANALGGAIEVVGADHQNKPDVGSQKAQELYDRNDADVIIDVPTSSVAIAVAGVAKDRKRLYLNTVAATTDLTGSACNKYTFHYAYDTYMLAQGTGSVVTQQVGKDWYIIYPNYAFGQDMLKSFTAAIEKAGGKVVASDATPFPNDDFSSFLLKAPTLGEQVLGTMQAGQDLVNVVKQYNEFKLKDQKISLAIGLLFDSDIKALGQDAYAGDLYTTAWVWTLDDQARQWADKFQKVAGRRPTFSHAADYSAAYQYLEAIRRAGTDDADAVVGALEGYKFNDFFARNATVRKEDHRVLHDAYLAQVKPASEAKEDGDYSNVLKTIPADQAFRPVSDAIAAGCKM